MRVRREVVVLDQLLIPWFFRAVQAAVDYQLPLWGLAALVLKPLAPVFARAVEAVIVPPCEAVGAKVASWIRDGGPPPQRGPSG